MLVCWVLCGGAVWWGWKLKRILVSSFLLTAKGPLLCFIAFDCSLCGVWSALLAVLMPGMGMVLCPLSPVPPVSPVLLPACPTMP